MRPERARVRHALVLAAGLCAASGWPAVASDEQAWPVAGQQGLVRSVIVPGESIRDREAYARQVRLLCQPQQTCFLNFYANPTGAPLAMPLPAAIESEATAVYRRSAKQQAERFMWSCRLQVGTEPCF